ncbi:MAG: hypothetical protein LBH51_04945, partial [Treponema sp.]|nr:hypothetical protein [Treponema sp.]
AVYPDYRIGKVDKRLFGAFLEPIRRWVYGNIWNPKHPGADSRGFRNDVLELIKSFGLSTVRLPGGNWISGWEWENSIGPLEQRKTQLDLAWRQYEPNIIGHDEYLEWSERAGIDPIYTLNLGSADLKSAFHCLDYTMHPGGTYWSDLRKKHGRAEPYNVKTWCLGNEMDGPWQIASWEKDPRGYAIKAHEIAKLIKWINKDCEAVACGSSYTTTFPRWDSEVLEQCYESVDYISMHHYYTAPPGNTDLLLNASLVFDGFIKTLIAACDYMKAIKRARKTMMIALDEYGASFSRPSEPVCWYDAARENLMEFSDANNSRPFVRYDSYKYNGEENGHGSSQMLDALALNSITLALIRNADRVKIGCMTGFLQQALQIDENHTWKTPAYYAYEQLNKYGRGISLMPVIDGPVHNVEQSWMDTWHQYPAFERVQDIEGAAVFNEEEEELSLFLINKNQKEAIPVDLDLRGFEGYKLIEHTEMRTDDINTANTWDSQPIKPVKAESANFENGRASSVVKSLSWNCIRIRK